MELLADLLDVRLREAVGIVEMLHHLTDQYAPRGDVGRFTDQQIARRVDWDGEPDFLMSALVRSGWVDRHPVNRLVVHDWPEHAPEYTKKKANGTKEKEGTGWAVDDSYEPEPEEPDNQEESGDSGKCPDSSANDSRKFQNFPEDSSLARARPSQVKAGQAKPGEGIARPESSEPAPAAPDPPAPEPEKPKPKRTNARTRAPDDLDADQRSRIRSLLAKHELRWYGPRVESGIRRCLAHFGGDGKLKADWAKTAWNWILKDIEDLADADERAMRKSWHDKQSAERAIAEAEVRAAQAPDPDPPPSKPAEPDAAEGLGFAKPWPTDGGRAS